MKAALKQLVKPVIVSLAGSLGPHTRAGSCPRLWLLMYHRVLPDTDTRYQQEEPGMLVRPETLDMHIQEIKKHFELVSLSDWISAKEANEPLPKRACAITFDDGWLDNYEYAYPILRAHGAPATLFAVAEKIGTDFQFWPNILAHLLLQNQARVLEQHPVFYSAVRQVTGVPSVDGVAAVIHQLKSYSDADIFNALEELNWRTIVGEPMPPALMNWDQLCEMQQSGLVEIGSHTCTHRRLTNALTPAELEYEIIQSKFLLEKHLQSPVDLFCFPNGDYNELALSLVKKHYRASVTTRRGINDSAAASMYELTRISIHDEVSCDRRLFRARLSGWV